jgi:hypothetical protein
LCFWKVHVLAFYLNQLHYMIQCPISHLLLLQVLPLCSGKNRISLMAWHMWNGTLEYRSSMWLKPISK